MTNTIYPTHRTIDPVLEEVWRVKAELNREANYDVRTLARAANAFVSALRPHRVSSTPHA